MLERVVDTKTAPDVSSPLFRCIAVSIIVFTTSTPWMISCSPNLPLHILDAHLLARFLIVVEPLAFLQIDAREQCSRLEPFCLPLPLRRVSQRTPMRSLGIFTHIGPKLGELQTPTVEFDNVNFLGWRAVYVGFGRFFYVGTRFSLHASCCISSD